MIVPTYHSSQKKELKEEWLAFLPEASAMSSLHSKKGEEMSKLFEIPYTLPLEERERKEKN